MTIVVGEVDSWRKLGEMAREATGGLVVTQVSCGELFFLIFHFFTHLISRLLPMKSSLNAETPIMMNG